MDMYQRIILNIVEVLDTCTRLQIAGDYTPHPLIIHSFKHCDYISYSIIMATFLIG